MSFDRAVGVTAHTYEVVVKGRVSPALVSCLCGFDLVRVQGGKSYLVGTVLDQARLFKMLKALRDLNIAVVSIHEMAPIDWLVNERLDTLVVEEGRC